MLSKVRSISPYLIEGCRCSVIMACGDVLAQTLVEKKKFEDLDFIRTVKYGSLGLLFLGPVMKYWYGFLNSAVTRNQSPLKRTLKMVLVDQSIMAPSLNLAVTAILGKMNGESNEAIKERIQVQYPVIMRNNYMLWPVVQMINFGFVPLKYQVVFVQVIAVVWNVFVSNMLNTKRGIEP